MITLLRANGHPGAGRYTMGRVLLESRLVQKMHRKQMAGAAAVLTMTANAFLDKKGGEARKQFQKYLSEA